MLDFSLSGNIQINLKRCSRYTFAKGSCDSCIKICPTGAIKLTPYPSISEDACIKCGLCYAACPTTAISIKNDNEKLLKETSSLSEIEIGCIFSTANNKISCIYRLDHSILTAWFLSGKAVKIKRGNCKSCKLKNQVNLFFKELRIATRLVKSSGIEPNIKINSSTAEKPHIPKEGLSRRELLSALKKPSSKPKRMLFLKKLNPIEKTECKITAKITITNSCDLCGICEVVCPTEVILIQKEQKGSIWFNPAACINCQNCQNGCLKGAIKLETGHTSLLKAKPQVVFEAEKKLCKNCKSFFYSNADEDICPTCKSKQSKKQSIIEMFKNI
ncbi:4Fe-4S dicluster domain-containing protein [Hippea maritima]|uniref:4Fe-4S ferredoxin iron-sulfur binding domain-containing protein n=1 Tax=Hippea maritima (strain ATCC 700847 / DSM 10411 / MH2) TaxID=760142 RepID=F2LX46_HIPMA|nr:4Fe-4S dicluster domain-containing protein [Hippea maritima]AEA33104.1 4Fe-4S ferredoxin iron-sulfur binding domain-containing protein [Hippea maritima DSM 10411]